MAVLQWHTAADRSYQKGVDKVVLYPADRIGVPWSGVTSIDEIANDEIEAVYYDAMRINTLVTIGEFSGILRAFTFPRAFYSAEGTYEDDNGVLITDQPRQMFSLAWRVQFRDTNDKVINNQIHLAYNLTATPIERSYQTLRLDEPEAVPFEWNIVGIPEDIEGYRPTSHIIFDQSRMDAFLYEDIEDLLYGTSEQMPLLPKMEGILSFIRKWNRLIIRDNDDGTWTATSTVDGVIVQDDIDLTSYDITSDTINFIAADTYEIGSTNKNEEDIV